MQRVGRVLYAQAASGDWEAMFKNIFLHGIGARIQHIRVAHGSTDGVYRVLRVFNCLRTTKRACNDAMRAAEYFFRLSGTAAMAV